MPTRQAYGPITRVIVHVITGLGQGGAETALFRLLSASEDKADHHVVSLSDEGVYGPRLRALGVSVTSLEMRAGRPSLLTLLRLVRLLRQKRVRVVQTWMHHANLIGGLAAWLARVPVCWGIRQGNLTKEINSRHTRMIAWLNGKLSSRVPSRMVSCSFRAAQVHVNFGFADEFVVIPNGVDLTVFSPDAAKGRRKRLELSISGQAKLLGHIGRFDPHKDYDNLLTAFSNLLRMRPDALLVLCGKGLDAANDELTRSIREKGLADAVILLGPRSDVADLMCSLDAFVLSSAGEAFPNVVIEAMACGVPCVVTDVGDAAQIVGSTGWVVPPRDPVALAKAMQEALAEMPEARAARGGAARRRIEDHYDIHRMVAAYHKVWHEAAQGKTQACAV